MISTHVLDLALGRPAAGIDVRLDLLGLDAAWRPLAAGATNDDGRAALLPPEQDYAGRTCRLAYDTRAYFERTGLPVFFPYVEVVFVVDASGRCHVPLLLSPFGYSTYRGS